MSLSDIQEIIDANLAQIRKEAPGSVMHMELVEHCRYLMEKQRAAVCDGVHSIRLIDADEVSHGS